MEKFNCDKRVKCLTTCSSDTSGSRGLSDLCNDCGISTSAEFPGACANARRPARDLLNINVSINRRQSLSSIRRINRNAKGAKRRLIVRFSRRIRNVLAVDDRIVFVNDDNGR